MLPPAERVEYLWSLQTTIPAFAFVLSHTPGLWMSWSLKGSRRSRQTPAVRFAINLWLDIRRRPEGKTHGVDLYITDPRFSYGDLLSLLPPESLPFIRYINIQVDRASIEMATFLTHFPQLSSLDVEVVDRVLAASGTYEPPCSTPMFTDYIVFAEDHAPITWESMYPTLTSLSLVGAALSLDILWTTDLSNIQSLSLTDQVIDDTVSPSLFVIFEETPRLQNLVFRMHWLYPHQTSHFWDIPSKPLLLQFTTALRSIDLAGDKRDVVGVVDSLTCGPNSNLDHIRVTLFCDACDDAPSFDELAAFNAELISDADDIRVDSANFRVTSRRSLFRTDAVEWSVEWKLVTISSGFWVCLTLFESVVHTQYTFYT